MLWYGQYATGKTCVLGLNRPLVILMNRMTMSCVMVCITRMTVGYVNPYDYDCAEVASSAKLLRWHPAADLAGNVTVGETSLADPVSAFRSQDDLFDSMTYFVDVITYFVDAMTFLM